MTYTRERTQGIKNGRFAVKKSPGPKNPPGFTAGQILTVVYNNPAGIDEPTIRAILKDDFDIREKKGVSNHLSNLLNEGYLHKIAPPPGGSNIWQPGNMGRENFCKLWTNFPDEVKEPLFSSAHVQELIKLNIVPSVIEDFRLIEIANKKWEKAARKLGHSPFKKIPSDIPKFIERACEMAPSLTFAKCQAPSREIWLLDSITYDLLAYSRINGGDIVTARFLSPVGNYIHGMVISLIVDMNLYPNKQQSISGFLQDSETKQILSFIFKRPDEVLHILQRARGHQNLDVARYCEDMDATNPTDEEIVSMLSFPADEVLQGRGA
ncbi:hypothetical protein [Methanoculleus sp.]|uniref:hypothetical protein n=1 Tax=Methanoculleus sp. TaxID=90427 RepID=UPI001BD24E2C|nr:hypothetical protein [Methanoculleus sp.]